MQWEQKTHSGFQDISYKFILDTLTSFFIFFFFLNEQFKRESEIELIFIKRFVFIIVKGKTCLAVRKCY